MLAVKQFFGSEGANQLVDIIRCDLGCRRFILRCESKNLVKLRAALTVADSFEGIACIYEVLRTTPNLLALAVNSRTFVH